MHSWFTRNNHFICSRLDFETEEIREGLSYEELVDPPAIFIDQIKKKEELLLDFDQSDFPRPDGGTRKGEQLLIERNTSRPLIVRGQINAAVMTNQQILRLHESIPGYQIQYVADARHLVLGHAEASKTFKIMTGTQYTTKKDLKNEMKLEYISFAKNTKDAFIMLEGYKRNSDSKAANLIKEMQQELEFNACQSIKGFRKNNPSIKISKKQIKEIFDISEHKDYTKPFLDQQAKLLNIFNQDQLRTNIYHGKKKEIQDFGEDVNKFFNNIRPNN